MALVMLYLRSLRGILFTLLVVVIALVMVRLGIWQLDRLSQRRAANAAIARQVAAPQLDLNAEPSGQDLTQLAYRQVKVTGKFDFSQQVYLRNQAWGNQLGVHLLTPLRMAGSSQAVLVDRGWIPFSDAVPGKVEQYNLPGMVSISGIIRLAQSEPTFGGMADPAPATSQTRLQSWVVVNLDRLQAQVPFSLLSIYVLQSPASNSNSLPYRLLTTPDLTEGPHLSYAIQWFSFTAILLIGYPLVLRRRLRNREKPENS